MKKIKLTEQDLRNIVTESVNRVISELDWRTYDNAKEQANDDLLNSDDDDLTKKRVRQRDAFAKASTDRMHKQYGVKPKDVEDVSYWLMGGRKNTKEDPSKTKIARTKRMVKDYNKHKDGKSKYVKGQGWQNKK